MTSFVPEKAASKAWMVTFSDLISLMLTFFVLLFSMSSLKVEEWEKVAEYVPARSRSILARTVMNTHSPLSVETKQALPGESLHYLHAVLEEQQKAFPPLKEVFLTQLPDRLVLSLPSALLFERGSARPKEGGETLLLEVTDLIMRMDNKIVVEGHTDPTPYKGGAFDSNWSLSMARAETVARYLKDMGLDNPIDSFGRADARFSDLSTSLPEEKRYELARRVDVILMMEAGLP